MKKTVSLLFAALFALSMSAQQFQLRLLNHWDNPNGTVERGFAGHSIWKWQEIPTDKKAKMPAHLVEKYKEYGRINQEYGINGTVLNNVNAKPEMLTTDMLKKTAKIADVLRPYGLKVYLSVNFASPKALGDLQTADPLDAGVQQWWVKKADEIYKLIPDFGGFLVKANSEGEPGPMDYKRTHVDGANMLARALQPHGGIVMWRSFVYASDGGDRASQALQEFMRFDGQFMDNVIIQIKNGPVDFQPREPISPLFLALKKTKMMIEFQITQEYTGHSIHTCYLAPMWKETLLDIFPSLNHKLGAKGTMPQQTNIVGLAGVANIGDAGWGQYDRNESGAGNAEWTANDLAMANWYAFGRLACDPTASSYDIARDFLKKTYTGDDRFVTPMTQLLVRTREAVVSYMMPLGLHHIFAGNHHYGPEPWYAPRGSREDWLPRYYHRADSLGLGFNRTDHDGGSANARQYPDMYFNMYNNIETCPEELLLWFHHVSWDHIMKDGLTMWDNLCYKYDEGIRLAESFVKTWEQMRPYVDAQMHARQLARFQRQARDAQWWHDACLLYFQTFSKKPFPADMHPCIFTLEELQKYKLRIDNYTAPAIDKLP